MSVKYFSQLKYFRGIYDDDPIIFLIMFSDSIIRNSTFIDFFKWKHKQHGFSGNVKPLFSNFFIQSI